MSPNFSKIETKKLCELSEIACNRELHHDLQHIASACRDLREGHVDETALDELLRHYVEGTSTTVLARYREWEPEVSVARALAVKSLEPEEVFSPLRKKLKSYVEALSHVFG